MQSILHYSSLALSIASHGIIAVGMVLIGIVFSSKPRWVLLALVGYCAVIAFLFVPTEHDDLYRYWWLIDRFRDYGWSGIKALYVNNYWFHTSYLYQLLLYGLSFFPNQLTGALVSCATYTMIGILDFRFFEEKQISPRLQSAIILLQFLSIDPYSVISSWLYMLTFSIMANILYTDLVEQKGQILCMIAYLLLGQMHTVAYVIFAFRIIVRLLPASARGAFLVCILLWRIFVKVMVAIAALFTGNMIAKRIFENLVYYSSLEENGNLIYMIALALFATACLLCIRRNQKEEADGNRRESMDDLVSCCCMFVLGAWGSQNLMFRFSHFVMMLLPLHIGTTLIRENEQRPFKMASLEIFLFYISVGLLLVYYMLQSYRWLLNRFLI